MKRVLSSLAAVVLLLGLGAIVVLALPATISAPAAVAPAAMAAAPSAQDQPVAAEALAAPDATQKYNNIGLPLDATQQFSDLGFTFDANGLADFIGRTSLQQVMHWNATAQNFEKWFPNVGSGVGTNFPLTTGEAYLIQVNSTAPSVLSLVGDVPEVGSVQFNLAGSSPSCKWNTITLPLDQSSITTASELSIAIGKLDVQEVRRWNAEAQNFEKWFPNVGSGVGTNFSTQIGYPYWLCMKQNKTWP